MMLAGGEPVSSKWAILLVMEVKNGDRNLVHDSWHTSTLFVPKGPFLEQLEKEN